MACLSPSLAPTEGKNIKDTEFSALGDMLAQMSWELPQVEEYKNDLVQPSFTGPGVPLSNSQAIVPVTTRTDPNGPPSADQWAKVNKMVA